MFNFHGNYKAYWGRGEGVGGKGYGGVSKETWCLTPTVTIRLIGDGEKGG